MGWMDLLKRRAVSNRRMSRYSNVQIVYTWLHLFAPLCTLNWIHSYPFEVQVAPFWNKAHWKRWWWWSGTNAGRDVWGKSAVVMSCLHSAAPLRKASVLVGTGDETDIALWHPLPPTPHPIPPSPPRPPLTKYYSSQLFSTLTQIISVLAWMQLWRAGKTLRRVPLF